MDGTQMTCSDTFAEEFFERFVKVEEVETSADANVIGTAKNRGTSQQVRPKTKAEQKGYPNDPPKLNTRRKSKPHKICNSSSENETANALLCLSNFNGDLNGVTKYADPTNVPINLSKKPDENHSRFITPSVRPIILSDKSHEPHDGRSSTVPKNGSRPTQQKGNGSSLEGSLFTHSAGYVIDLAEVANFIGSYLTAPKSDCPEALKKPNPLEVFPVEEFPLEGDANLIVDGVVQPTDEDMLVIENEETGTPTCLTPISLLSEPENSPVSPHPPLQERSSENPSGECVSVCQTEQITEKSSSANFSVAAPVLDENLSEDDLVECIELAEEVINSQSTHESSLVEDLPSREFNDRSMSPKRGESAPIEEYSTSNVNGALSPKRSENEGSEETPVSTRVTQKIRNTRSQSVDVVPCVESWSLPRSTSAKRLEASVSLQKLIQSKTARLTSPKGGPGESSPVSPRNETSVNPTCVAPVFLLPDLELSPVLQRPARSMKPSDHEKFDVPGTTSPKHHEASVPQQKLIQRKTARRTSHEGRPGECLPVAPRNETAKNPTCVAHVSLPPDLELSPVLQRPARSMNALDHEKLNVPRSTSPKHHEASVPQQKLIQRKTARMTSQEGRTLESAPVTPRNEPAKNPTCVAHVSLPPDLERSPVLQHPVRRSMKPLDHEKLNVPRSASTKHHETSMSQQKLIQRKTARSMSHEGRPGECLPVSPRDEPTNNPTCVTPVSLLPDPEPSPEHPVVRSMKSLDQEKLDVLRSTSTKHQEASMSLQKPIQTRTARTTSHEGPLGESSPVSPRGESANIPTCVTPVSLFAEPQHSPVLQHPARLTKALDQEKLNVPRSTSPEHHETSESLQNLIQPKTTRLTSYENGPGESSTVSPTVDTANNATCATPISLLPDPEQSPVLQHPVRSMTPVDDPSTEIVVNVHHSEDVAEKLTTPEPVLTENPDNQSIIDAIPLTVEVLNDQTIAEDGPREELVPAPTKIDEPSITSSKGCEATVVDESSHQELNESISSEEAPVEDFLPRLINGSVCLERRNDAHVEDSPSKQLNGNVSPGRREGYPVEECLPRDLNESKRLNSCEEDRGEDMPSRKPSPQLDEGTLREESCTASPQELDQPKGTSSGQKAEPSSIELLKCSTTNCQESGTTEESLTVSPMELLESTNTTPSSLNADPEPEHASVPQLAETSHPIVTLENISQPSRVPHTALSHCDPTIPENCATLKTAVEPTQTDSSLTHDPPMIHDKMPVVESTASIFTPQKNVLSPPRGKTPDDVSKQSSDPPEMANSSEPLEEDSMCSTSLSINHDETTKLAVEKRDVEVDNLSSVCFAAIENTKSTQAVVNSTRISCQKPPSTPVHVPDNDRTPQTTITCSDNSDKDIYDFEDDSVIIIGRGNHWRSKKNRPITYPPSRKKRPEVLNKKPTECTPILLSESIIVTRSKTNPRDIDYSSTLELPDLRIESTESGDERKVERKGRRGRPKGSKNKATKSSSQNESTLSQIEKKLVRENLLMNRELRVNLGRRVTLPWTNPRRVSIDDDEDCEDDCQSSSHSPRRVSVDDDNDDCQPSRHSPRRVSVDDDDDDCQPSSHSDSRTVPPWPSVPPARLTMVRPPVKRHRESSLSLLPPPPSTYCRPHWRRNTAVPSLASALFRYETSSRTWEFDRRPRMPVDERPLDPNGFRGFDYEAWNSAYERLRLYTSWQAPAKKPRRAR